MKKSELLKKLNEGLSISEIIDSNLNLIGNNDDVETPEQIKTDATTDNFFDAVTQQMGKDRRLGVYVESDDELNEANSDLQDQEYKIPLDILSFLKTKVGEGGDRIQGILNKSSMNYSQIKRFKHDIENSYQGDWSKVLTWINSVLTSDRNFVDKQKRTPMELGVENRFKKTHDKNHAQLTSLSSLFEGKKVIKITEEQYKLIKKQ